MQASQMSFANIIINTVETQIFTEDEISLFLLAVLINEIESMTNF